MPTLSDIRDLEFDETNRQHLARHGLDENLVEDVFASPPILWDNEPRPGRSGSHVLVGPSSAGRHWTIVIVEVNESLGLWRPITRVAEHREGDPTVAGRRLTPEEEERLIAEAWADRDDDSIVWAKSDVQISPDMTFVLSVQVSRAQVRALGDLAAKRNQSLTELLEATVLGLIAVAPVP